MMMQLPEAPSHVFLALAGLALLAAAWLVSCYVVGGKQHRQPQKQQRGHRGSSSNRAVPPASSSRATHDDESAASSSTAAMSSSSSTKSASSHSSSGTPISEDDGDHSDAGSVSCESEPSTTEAAATRSAVLCRSPSLSDWLAGPSTTPASSSLAD